jgi:hypothetical protein
VLAALVINVVTAEMLDLGALRRQVRGRPQRLRRETRPQAVLDGDGPGGLTQQDVIVRGAKRRHVPDGYLSLAAAKLRVIVSTSRPRLASASTRSIV